VGEPALYPSDLPPWLPEEWRTAANRLLAVSGNMKGRPDILRILNDARMREVCAVFDRRACEVGMDADPQRRHLLLLMVTKGGAMPTETAGQIKARRKRIAKSLRASVKALEGDPATKRIGVAEALHWAVPDVAVIEGRYMARYVKADGGYETAPYLLAEAVGLAAPNLTEVLAAVAARLESGAIVGFIDPLHLTQYTVQPGRGRRAHLERVLAEHFHIMTLPAAVIAPIIEVSLDLSPGSIDVPGLADRLRKI
jgi:hypothetical protein